MTRGVWIYFDLGINGDYEGMYAWLDNHGAHACGEHLAFVRYEFEDDLFNELKNDVSGEVDLAPKDYIYVIFQDEPGNTVGRFLTGRRMRSPWSGYGTADSGDVVDVSQA
jgi:hypothetical protein